MQFLKNKHMILAMFVAPILAIIAYFAVDYTVSETPHAAQQGKSYKLLAKSNCRYESGICTLQNGDIELKLRAQQISENQIEFNLNPNLSINTALISFVDHESSQPTAMIKNPENHNSWHVKLKIPSPQPTAIRLAFNISGSLYYAETSTAFMNYKTSFSQKNFSN